jgi:hypothetical protein
VSRPRRRPGKPGKKLWSIGGTASVSLCTEVWADTLEEAKEIAEQRAVQSICHQCSSADSITEWALCDGLDGDVVLYEDPDAHCEVST